MTCTSCGRENIEGALYCAFCGAELQPREEAAAAASEAPTPLDPAAAPPPPPPVFTAPPPAYPGVAYPYEPTPPEAETSGMATASLVLGILGFCTVGIASLIGLILGIVSLIQISGSQGRLRGQGVAIAGTVVSALGVLMLPMMAAILFPVFARAREKARQASCQSNEKQLALGVLMYAQDYDEIFPMKSNWADGVMPYVKNTMIFRCPSERNQMGDSYAYNERLDRCKVAKIPRPAEAVMLFDSQPGKNMAGGRGLVSPRHVNGANLAFADGHVKWYAAHNLDGLLWDPRSTSATPFGGALAPPWGSAPTTPGSP
ncbi:MAG: DUF4190 domain-containing protein [Armatimonadetes bacterium]|nr:DUF4190 domain-containing protein [Armatimonadota bacterium]